MKKSLLAIGAACMTLSSMAAPGNALPNALTQQKASAPFKFEAGKTSDQSEIVKLSRPANGTQKAPAKLGKPEDIITEALGRHQNITLIGTGYFLQYGE